MDRNYKGKIIKNYLRKFSNTTSTALARKIYTENSKEFKDEETCRTLIRYYRGLIGDKNRKKINKEFKIKPYTFDNKYKLPKSDAEKPKVFILKESENNILVLSDLHIPYHDINALTQAIDYGKKEKINTIIINGDLIDFYQISRFTNTERRRSVSEELDITREFLKTLHKIFPNTPIYFLKGNHDLRLELYLANKAPELLDCEEFQLEYLLNKDLGFKIKVLDDITLIKAGKLNITHGHLLIRGVFAPVNPARGAFMKAKKSVMIGHTHKVSTHSEVDLNGKVMTCYSTGCLCELNPRYSPFANNFSHGFAHIKVGKDGHYKVKNLQIVDGEIVN